MFQSTLPTRAATHDHGVIELQSVVSIHAAHAGSDGEVVQERHPDHVSIHAAHAGSDLTQSPSAREIPLFQSTLPTRAATHCGRIHWLLATVSIHAAHAGSDACVAGASCGSGFQSTLPTRAATALADPHSRC